VIAPTQQLPCSRRVTAKFQINRSGWAYRTNEHIWDPRWTDFSDWNWPETGNLSGTSSWYDDFTFNVDDRGADYDGELNRADVWTTGGPNGSTWCYAINPKVTAVVIW